MSADISDSEAKELHNAEKKIYEKIKWDFDGQKHHTEARVDCLNRDDVLRLTVWYNTRGDYSFSLLYRNAIIIKRWGNHPGHRNPDGELVDGPHKHYYQEGYEDDDWAYNTSDVSTSDLRQGFFDFLDEESIELAKRDAFQTPLIEYND